MFFMIFYKYFFILFFCKQKAPKCKSKTRTLKEIINKVEGKNNVEWKV